MQNLQDLKNSFKDPTLFDHALTHKSWVNEHPNVRTSNERLEFLGDAVLEFVVSKEIYNYFPDKEEGYLTALRANLVNTVNLAELAKRLGLGELLYLSRGEDDGGGRTNASLLADTVEAIIGAIFLDQGIDQAYNFISANLLSEISDKVKQNLKDPKSRIQEYLQSQSLPAPKYKVVEALGPDHDKKFVIEIIINGEPFEKGEGKSKSEAEQEAARLALNKINKEKFTDSAKSDII